MSAVHADNNPAPLLDDNDIDDPRVAALQRASDRICASNTINYVLAQCVWFQETYYSEQPVFRCSRKPRKLATRSLGVVSTFLAHSHRLSAFPVLKMRFWTAFLELDAIQDRCERIAFENWL